MEYRKKNKEKIKEYNLEYKKRNPEKIKEIENNRDKVKKKESYNKWRKENPWNESWRSILKSCLKRIHSTKEDLTIELLGYSALELKEHLEKLFLEGMDWSNRNEWHIDHIRPISSFDKDDDIKMINSLENLRPLWKEDNLKKGNKF